jgi:glycosyltransferase involved in cell wall biosynthesis
MGAEARRRVEAHFGWEAIARQTLEYYEELRETREHRKKLKGV